MKGNRKLEGAVTLFAAIETKQHETLRRIAFDEKRSMADVVREALNEYIKNHAARRKPVAA